MGLRRNIVLIGMPGAGKSTVGVLLAKAVKCAFLDTDLLVQTTTDRFLHQLIADEGMEAFLDRESAIIRAGTFAGQVIATGGSVVYRERTMRHLREGGFVIFLDAPYEVIEERLRDITTRGVVRRPEQTLRELYAERHPLYVCYADATISTANQSPEEVVTMLVALLRTTGNVE